MKVRFADRRRSPDGHCSRRSSRRPSPFQLTPTVAGASVAAGWGPAPRVWVSPHHHGGFNGWWIVGARGCSTLPITAHRRWLSAGSPPSSCRTCPRRRRVGISARAPAPTTLHPDLPRRLAQRPGHAGRPQPGGATRRRPELALLRERQGYPYVQRCPESGARSPPAPDTAPGHHAAGPNRPGRASSHEHANARPVCPAAPACCYSLALLAGCASLPSRPAVAVMPPPANP